MWAERWAHVHAYNAELSYAANVCQEWALEIIQHKQTARLLVLCGNSGTGKTALLKGIRSFLKVWRVNAYAAGAWSPGPMQVMYEHWMTWANLDLSKFNDADLFGDLEEPDVLLLDDVGSEPDQFKSGAANANLAYLLGERHDAHKWTAITTNYLPEQWVGTETRPGKFGVRLGDRLYRNSVIVPIRATQSWAIHQRRKP